MSGVNHPAFPHECMERVKIKGSDNYELCNVTYLGLTKREYFAAKAMAALLTGIFAHDLMVDKVGDFIDSEGIKIRDFIKIKSYDMADIMLKEESDQS